MNSANLGPYGDAIVQELIPYLEKKYRGLGEGWARFMYGGSTGGWEAMAAQVFYPEVFNGAYVACPDPIDFRAFTTVDLYEDKNAYWLDDPFKQHAAARPSQLARPRRRDAVGGEPAGAGAGHADALGPAVRHLGGGVLPGRAATATPSASGTRARARSTSDVAELLARALRPGAHPEARLGARAWARSSRASSTSTSATWTTTT